ncbi:MAG: DUF368 domain-containing protein [Methanimicrococcus sp.]|nr:DUF368 domain-containing protein [Methanimicrococcus sp.]
MIKLIRDFLNGIAFGITETVPGVSGGTIAIVFGFYAELIETVNHFFEDYRKYLKFVIPFVIGAAAGLITFSSIINYLLTNFSFPTMVFFIGLVVGIIPHIYSKVKEPGRWFTAKETALIVLPMLALMLISHLKPVTVTDPATVISGITLAYMIFLFFSGMIAAAALVMPGVSGSFVLLLIGIYHIATYSVSSIRHLVLDITNVSLMTDIGKVLVPLGLGIVVGGLLMTRLIEKLLQNHHKTTYSIILGLLIGSVYALFRDPIVYQSGLSVPLVGAGVVTFLLGCVISYHLGKKRL